ncbi:MAG: NAD(P)-dependent oxidoreductase [Actinobacteria bacterium]|nr:NAD(P)-dependent oxidoreductase [Actinomycetota bacterium]
MPPVDTPTLSCNRLHPDRRTRVPEERTKRLGWIGAGRMGVVLADRLLRSGCDVAVYNRTRAKAEPLEAAGATLVDAPIDLADRDIVLTMVASTQDLLAVTDGPNGLFTGRKGPGLLVDCSTVASEGSEQVRRRATQVGTRMLAAPVSGNPKVAKTGRLSLVASGPRDAFDEARPYLEILGRAVTYVGDGETARLVKIAHNLLLGVVTQCLAEITVLAERGGVARSDLLAFINDSVMGSTFSRYKTPAFVNLDFHPTFTSRLLRKDLELGLEAGRRLDVPLPVTAAVHQIVTALIGSGHGDEDFATLLLLEAAGAGMELEPERVPVDDGLHPIDDLARDAMREK